MDSKSRSKYEPAPNTYELDHLDQNDGPQTNWKSTYPGVKDDGDDTNPLKDINYETYRHVRVRPIWAPPYLSRPVLFIFVAIYATLLLALVVLFGYSESHQGLSTANERYVYIWLYGPTAVFILIATFWDQVVYRVKQLAPWMAMMKSFQPASKSLLIDYVSPSAPTTFHEALRNSHLMVVVAVTSTLAFTVMVISATGLFSLQYADVVQANAEFTIFTKFDLSHFDVSSVDARPAVTAYSARNFKSGTYPSGTTGQYAVQDFGWAGDENSTLVAVVDTFSADLDCEPADVTLSEYRNTSSILSRYFSPSFDLGFNVTSSNCTLTNFTIPFRFNSNSTGDQNAVFGDYGWGVASYEQCSGVTSHRVFVTTGYIRVNLTVQCAPLNATVTRGCNLTQSLDQSIVIHNSTNLICSPRVGIGKSRVTRIPPNATAYTQYSSIVPVQAAQGSTQDAEKIAQGVFGAFSDPTATSFYGSPIGLVQPSLTSTSFAFLLGEFPYTWNESSANRYWLSNEYLQQAIKGMYTSVAAQIARQKLSVPTNNHILGQAITNEPRLFVRTLSFVFIEAGLLVLLLASLYFVFSIPKLSLADDPGSIRGVATVLASSSELSQLFKSTGNVDAQSLVDLAQSHEYKLLSNQVISVRPNNNSLSGSKPDEFLNYSDSACPSSSISWWRPFLLGRFAAVVVVLLPLLYLVLLEVLFRVSESHNGLASISSSSWVHYGWTYIPALLMVCIHTIYQSISFNIQMLSPYAALKKGSAPAVRSVEDHPFSRIALHQLFVSIVSSRLAILAATLAVLLAPLLTIVVSGLYSPEATCQSVMLRPVTGWGLGYASADTILGDIHLLSNIFYGRNESNPALGANSDAIIPSVLTANLTSPKRTHEEFAFPVLETLSLERVSYNDTNSPLFGLLTASVPAIRANMNCTLVPQDQVTITYATINSTYNASNYLTPLTHWTGTLNAKYQGNRYCLNQTQAHDSGIIKQQLVNGCHMAIFDVKNNYSIEGCRISPHVVLQPSSGIFGTTTFTMIEEYTWFVCATSVDSVNTTLELSLPSYTINKILGHDENSIVKIPGNATWRLLDDDYNDYPRVFQGTNAALNSNGPFGLNPNGALSFLNFTDTQNYDNFISTLIYGKYGIPASELLGPANSDRLISACRHLWSVIWAMNLIGFPSALPENIAAEQLRGSWNGTFHGPDDYRLVQNVVSTRVLQAILASLSLCAIVTFLFIDTRRVLPYNPCSIAAVISLLAGSEMLDIIAQSDRVDKDESAEAPHDGAYLSPAGSWQGYFFSLGWWRLQNNRWRFGIDVGKADKTA